MAFLRAKEYHNEYLYDVEIYSILGVLSLMNNDHNSAKEYLKEGFKISPYNYDINYNLGYIYYNYDGNYGLAEKHLSKCLESSNNLEDSISEISNFYRDDIKVLLSENNKLFPLKNKSETWLGKPMFKSNNESYTPLYYKNRGVEYPLNLWYFYRNEIYRTQERLGKFEYRASEDVIIPIGLRGIDRTPKIYINSKLVRNVINNKKNFEYLKLGRNDTLEIDLNDEIILGNPIELKDDLEYKLIMNIFIDGLSQKILNDLGIENLMPNTYDFFKKGMIFLNCYNNAEWTLSSVPTILTGKYQVNHKFFHPELNHEIESNYFLPEILSKKGYLTFQSNQNWRLSPSYGYIKGFDRTIYQSAVAGSNIENTIMDFFEQIRAFKSRGQYLFLTIFDLHNIADNSIADISSKILNANNVFNQDKKKSVYSSYDADKVNMYINEINRIDYYLGTIYSFIEKNYKNEDIHISLISDHGQSYLSEEEFIFKEERHRVPFMMRGKNINSMLVEESIENIDILPITLHSLGIDYDLENIDGSLPKILGGAGKDYLYAESIYPGKKYEAFIKYNGKEYMFKSGGLVENDGRFELGDYELKLYKSDAYIEDINYNKVMEIISNHIKYNLIY